MNRYRLEELLIKVVLWIAVIAAYLMYMAGMFESLPDRMETFLITLMLSIVVILIWFMPTSIADRKLNKGLKYLDKDNDKAAQCFEKYMNSKMLTDNERRNALRILGVAHHKRGADKEAIKCLSQALEGHTSDNDLKVELLGAMGIIYSEAGEYQKAVEHFDRTFDIIFAISKAHIDKSILVQVINTYIAAGQKEKAVQIYDRLMMIRGFKRNKKAEEILGIGEDS